MNAKKVIIFFWLFSKTEEFSYQQNFKNVAHTHDNKKKVWVIYEEKPLKMFEKKVLCTTHKHYSYVCVYVCIYIWILSTYLIAYYIMYSSLFSLYALRYTRSFYFFLLKIYSLSSTTNEIAWCVHEKLHRNDNVFI